MIALAQLYSTYLPRPFQLKIPCWINSDDNYESSVGDRTSWSTHTAAVWIQVTFWDADCLSGPSGFLDFLFLWKHQFLLLSLQERRTWLLPVIFLVTNGLEATLVVNSTHQLRPVIGDWNWRPLRMCRHRESINFNYNTCTDTSGSLESSKIVQ